MKFSYSLLIFVALQSKLCHMKVGTSKVEEHFTWNPQPLRWLYLYHIKGPFKTTPISVKDCPKTTLPRPKPEFGPVETYWMEIYNTSTRNNLIKGNLTLYNHNSGITFQSEGYIWKGGKWKHHVAVPSMDCTNPIIAFLSKMVNISYDPEKCSFPKGIYPFSKIDMNAVEHMWSRERDYGRVLWKSEVMTKYNTLFCLLVETLVEPLQN